MRQVYLSKRSITLVIKNMVKRYGDYPEEINSGKCHYFAMDVINEMGGENKNLKYVHVNDHNGGLTHLYHGFIKYKKKYYDAEHPDGVKDWKDLVNFRDYGNFWDGKEIIGLENAKKFEKS